jgi:oligopeptide transport system ATP-binding protein
MPPVFAAVSSYGRGVSGVDTILEVQNLKVHFTTRQSVLSARRKNILKAVDGINFSISEGEVLGLVGESGCGKSTASRAILQLIPPTAGKVFFRGQDLTHLNKAQLRKKRKNFQMIFQDPYASLNPSMTVEQTISELLQIHAVGNKQTRRDQVKQILQEVDLNPEFLDRYPHEFSGGQRQRISIARALVLKPEFLVADEPVSSLDVSVQAQIINLLQNLQAKHGLTFLFISHDLSVVRHITQRIAIMYLGRIVELAPTAAFYTDPHHPYSRALLSAVPVPDPRIELNRKQILLTGEVPSGFEIPQGCRFSSRCWKRKEECVTVEPELKEVQPGHFVACYLC